MALTILKSKDQRQPCLFGAYSSILPTRLNHLSCGQLLLTTTQRSNRLDSPKGHAIVTSKFI